MLGIIGGGQLGMFLCQSAKKRDIKTVVLDPNPNCSCKDYCDTLIVSKYDDQENINKLFNLCDYVTYEFENIDLEVLTNNDTSKLIPNLNSLLYSKDRLLEKSIAKASGFNVGNYYQIDNMNDLKYYLKDDTKYILKTCSDGYNGLNQVVISSNNINDALPLLNQKCIIEEIIDFDYELSIIGAINLKGQFIFHSTNINVHRNRTLFSSILVRSTKLKTILKKFMILNNLNGILTIELFCKDNVFYFNEMACRPHNSGHTSLDGCNISQYDLVISSIYDKKFKKIKTSECMMFNLYGKQIDYFKENKIDNVIFYDYHKEYQPNRKMGHINVIDLSLENKITKILEDTYE